MSPVFSVVIPVFNRASIVDRPIRSVLAQTFQDFEILIVDDGSTDDLSARLKPYQDPRIRLVHQQNRGAGAARNRGVDFARGTFVAFLDSDDAFLPHHLNSMKLLMDNNEDAVAYAPVRAQRGRNHFVKPPLAIAPGENMASYLMCARGFVQTSGLVAPVRFAQKVRYRDDASYGDDTDFAIRLQLAGYRFVMADKPGVDWYDGPDPDRLSYRTHDSSKLAWLEDLKPNIPAAAYLAYRGWHIAKGMFRRRPFTALRLYLLAVTSGAYGPKLALIVLAQIILPGKIYRKYANMVLRIKSRHPPTIPSGNEK